MASTKMFARYIPLLGLLGAGCASGGHEHHYFHKTERPHAAEWGYTGANGPDHWGELDPQYALAKSGRMQSPIDIGATQQGKVQPLSFDYRPVTINLVYNGHTIEEQGIEASAIQLGTTRYELHQFHFHSPSEHTVRGEHFPMEMHLVHKSAAGAVAVVSVLIREGAENPAYAPIWDCLPSAASKERASTTQVDVAALLPADRASYRYEGSFTTPPCTEGVHWVVLRAPVSLSGAQIAAFRAVIDHNNRPVQPLNGRSVLVAGYRDRTLSAGLQALLAQLRDLARAGVYQLHPDSMGLVAPLDGCIARAGPALGAETGEDCPVSELLSGLGTLPAHGLTAIDVTADSGPAATVAMEDSWGSAWRRFWRSERVLWPRSVREAASL